jgi:hypothetical protein
LYAVPSAAFLKIRTNCSGVPAAGTFENANVVMLDAILKSTTLPLSTSIVVVVVEVIAWRVLSVNAPPPAGFQVLSPRKKVVELAVPVAKRAVATVPLERLVAFKLVTFEPVPLNAMVMIPIKRVY